MSRYERVSFNVEEDSFAENSLLLDVPEPEVIEIVPAKNVSRRVLKSPSSITSTTTQSLFSDASVLTNRITNGDKSSKLTSLKDALEINVKMRQKLQEETAKLKAALQKNLEKQAVLKQITAEEKLQKHNAKPPNAMRAISVFAHPYFRDQKKMLPPANEDAIAKRKNCDVNAYLIPPRPWSHKENQKLLNGVTAFALMTALKPYKIRRDFLKSKLKNNKNLTDEDIENLKNEVSLVEQEIEMVSKRPLHEMLDNLNGEIDWMTISAVDMEGERSPDDCERFWKNYLDFSINKEAFTEEEDEKLRSLAEKHQERNWDKVAKDLKTKRTAVQCFERYQTKLNLNLTKTFFTKEEDELLLALIEKYKVGKVIPWNKISYYMEGRTRQQIMNRYERSLSQIYNRGPWTTEEDAILVACHNKFGLKWVKMKPFFKRRSTYSIRERYVNVLDPSIRMGSWTVEEDKRLISLIRKFGFGKWSKICRHINGRTDNMCLVRANKLLEYSMKYHSDKGVDYDPDVYDPELFAKILKPIAPTKNCANRNFKVKSCREDAFNLFLQVLETVEPSLIGDTSLSPSEFDFKLLSYETLQRVSDELHQMIYERERGNPPYKPIYRHNIKAVKVPKRKYPSDEEEEEEEDDFEDQPEPVVVPPDQELWISRAIAEIFKQANKLLCPRVLRMYELTSREQVETNLYKAYLYKQFHCKAPCDKGDDLEYTVFNGVDFSESLHTTSLYFVQPPIYENQSIIMAPNLETLGGMDVIETTEPRIQDMASFVNFSSSYLNYLCEKTSESPKCLQCTRRDGDKQLPQKSQADILSAMRKKFFATYDTLEEAALVESGEFSDFKEKCSCEALKNSLNSVKLLRQRLIGLLLWPALLSSTRITDTQLESLYVQRTEAEKDYYSRIKEHVGGLAESNQKLRKTSSEAEAVAPVKPSDLESQESLASQENEALNPKPVEDCYQCNCGKRKLAQSIPLRRSKRLCVLNKKR